MKCEEESLKQEMNLNNNKILNDTKEMNLNNNKILNDTKEINLNDNEISNDTKENTIWKALMELKSIYQIIFILILILFVVIVYLIVKFKGSVSHEKEKIN